MIKLRRSILSRNHFEGKVFPRKLQHYAIHHMHMNEYYNVWIKLSWNAQALSIYFLLYRCMWADELLTVNSNIFILLALKCSISEETFYASLLHFGMSFSLTFVVNLIALLLICIKYNCFKLWTWLHCITISRCCVNSRDVNFRLFPWSIVI